MANDEAALRAAYPQVVAEVPGSPVFLVTLCKGARHIEVQVSPRQNCRETRQTATQMLLGFK